MASIQHKLTDPFRNFTVLNLRSIDTQSIQTTAYRNLLFGREVVGSRNVDKEISGDIGKPAARTASVFS